MIKNSIALFAVAFLMTQISNILGYVVPMMPAELINILAFFVPGMGAGVLLYRWRLQVFLRKHYGVEVARHADKAF